MPNISLRILAKSAGNMVRIVLILLLTYSCKNKTPPSQSVKKDKVSIDTISSKVLSALPIIAPKQDTSLKDGPYIQKYPNGIAKLKGYLKKGLKNGEWQSFYPSGRLWSDDYFNMGVMDGKTTVYYENSQLRYEGSYTKGKPSGVWRYWDTKGKLQTTTDFSTKKN